MKKFLLFLTNCLFFSLTAAPIQERTIPQDALMELAAEMGIPKGADLVEETQKRWLRETGRERWEMKEISPEKREFVLDWAEKQGLYSPWEAAQRKYDSALILGSSTYSMENRLAYLVDLWNQGVRFEEIIWLTGQRPLDGRVEHLTESAKTESEAAQIIWKTANLPQEMRDVSVQFIRVPMKERGKRPNTADTLFAWMETNPTSKTALFVSCQPFCLYQYAITDSYLPEDLSFDLVGPGVNPNSHPAAAAITLDTIARWLFQIHTHPN